MQNLSTDVKVIYTDDVNVSITVRDGRIDKVTTWVSGVQGSTVGYGDTAVPPAVLRTLAKPVRRRRTKRAVRAA